MKFWESLDKLLGSTRPVVDRTTGSHHPDYPDLIYPLDYGYLRGPSGCDGHEIDIWCGSGDRSRVVGVVCVTDTVKKGTGLKPLLGCTESEMDDVLAFYNESDSLSAMLVKRD